MLLFVVFQVILPVLLAQSVIFSENASNDVVDFFRLDGNRPTFMVSSKKYTDISECIKTCMDDHSCIGFYIAKTGNTCLHMTVYSGFSITLDQRMTCQYYIKNRPNVYDRPNLSFINRLLFNNAYHQNKNCPFNKALNPASNTCAKPLSAPCSVIDKTVFPNVQCQGTKFIVHGINS